MDRRWGIGFLMVLVALGACKRARANGSSASPTRDPSAKEFVLPALPIAHVVLTDAIGGLHVVEVEVAATSNSRTRGMMWRTQLLEGKGMLFVFPKEELQSFWMKNTLISLDLIFIDKNGTIAGVVANAPPQSLQSRSPGRPSKYVLEVPAGWAARNQIAAGSRVRFDDLAKITVE